MKLEISAIRGEFRASPLCESFPHGTRGQCVRPLFVLVDVNLSKSVSEPPHDWSVTHRDACIGLGCISRNGEQELGGGHRRSSPRDHKLSTLGVKLGGIRLMKRQQLMADEIIPSRQVLGNGTAPLQILDHNRRRPVIRVEHAPPQAHLVDLEPPPAAAVARRKVAGALEQPHHDRPLLVGPLLVHGRDVLAGLDGRAQLGAGAPVAPHLGVGHVEDGAVVVPLPLDGLGAGFGGEAVVAGVFGAADGVAGDGAVAGC